MPGRTIPSRRIRLEITPDPRKGCATQSSTDKPLTPRVRNDAQVIARDAIMSNLCSSLWSGISIGRPANPRLCAPASGEPGCRQDLTNHHRSGNCWHCWSEDGAGWLSWRTVGPKREPWCRATARAIDATIRAKPSVSRTCPGAICTNPSVPSAPLTSPRRCLPSMSLGSCSSTGTSPSPAPGRPA
jgi:hypothetical protein